MAKDRGIDVTMFVREVSALDERDRAVVMASVRASRLGGRAEQERLADALTRREDALEVAHQGDGIRARRAAVRATRRRLELALWP